MSSARLEKEERATGPEEAGAPVEGWGWTRTQRVGLGVMLFLLVVLLTIQYVRRPYRWDDHVVVVHGDRVALAKRIDVNRATAEELARIPHVGEKLAATIVAYREARRGMAADGVVFRQLEDLEKVPRMGKGMVEELRGYLAFPEAETEP